MITALKYILLFAVLYFIFEYIEALSDLHKLAVLIFAVAVAQYFEDGRRHEEILYEIESMKGKEEK